MLSERKHPKIYLAASVQVAGAGFGERMGQHCRSGAWKHSYAAWSCSSPRPRNSWEVFGKNAADVQCCDNVTTWLLWTGRCSRHAWHWWPGKTPFPKLSIANHHEESLHCTCNADDDDNEPPLIQSTPRNKPQMWASEVKMTVWFFFHLQLVVAGCIYSGSSAGDGMWDAWKHSSTRSWHKTSNCCGKLVHCCWIYPAIFKHWVGNQMVVSQSVKKIDWQNLVDCLFLPFFQLQNQRERKRDSEDRILKKSL